MLKNSDANKLCLACINVFEREMEKWNTERDLNQRNKTFISYHRGYVVSTNKCHTTLQLITAMTDSETGTNLVKNAS